MPQEKEGNWQTHPSLSLSIHPVCLWQLSAKQNAYCQSGNSYSQPATGERNGEGRKNVGWRKVEDEKRWWYFCCSLVLHILDSLNGTSLYCKSFVCELINLYWLCCIIVFACIPLGIHYKYRQQTHIQKASRPTVIMWASITNYTLTLMSFSVRFLTENSLWIT